jgi:hypothetical protein
MKQLLSLFLFLLPCLAWAQYPSNGNQKITLGEQTTADGLIFRGLAADTTRKPSIDTMAYIILDTATNIQWHYKKAVSNAWLRIGGSISSGLTGTLPVANGGTNASTFTTGSVVFAGSGGTYTQDNSNLFYNKDKYNLGLGVKPTNLSDGSYSHFQVGESGVIAALYSGASVMNFGQNYYNNAGWTRLTTDASSQIQLNTGTMDFRVAPTGSANSAITWTIAMNIDNTGKIGLGTSSPSSRLVVKGVDGTSSNSSLNVTNSSDASLLFVRNDGNVGIGTATPGSKLTIKGGNGNQLFLDNGGEDFTQIDFALNGVAKSFLVVDHRTGFKGLVFGNQVSQTDYRKIMFRPNGSTDVMVINDDKVGIGTASPDYKLDINSSSTHKTIMLRANAVGTRFDAALEFNAINVRTVPYARIGLQVTGASSDDETGGLTFWTINSGTLSEKMSITSTGNVLFNCQTLPSASVSGFTINGNSSGNFSSSGSSTAAYNHFLFYNGNGIVGSISTSGSTTSYTINSDYRLKEDLKEIKGLEKINNIKVYDYKWKNDNFRMDGVLAHELQEVIPYAVQGEKDGKEMQGVDYSKLVPILIKSVQELSAEIDVLKQEIINLKNK